MGQMVPQEAWKRTPYNLHNRFWFKSASPDPEVRTQAKTNELEYGQRQKLTKLVAGSFGMKATEVLDLPIHQCLAKK